MAKAMTKAMAIAMAKAMAMAMAAAAAAAAAAVIRPGYAYRGRPPRKSTFYWKLLSHIYFGNFRTF